MRNYKNYEIWKKAHELSLTIYKISNNFPKTEQYGLTSQLRRAAVSIALNIVEGSGRKSEKEFSQFLYIAAASAGETEYITQLCADLSYIDQKESIIIVETTNHLRRMIYNFIKKLS